MEEVLETFRIDKTGYQFTFMSLRITSDSEISQMKISIFGALLLFLSQKTCTKLDVFLTLCNKSVNTGKTAKTKCSPPQQYRLLFINLERPVKLLVLWWRGFNKPNCALTAKPCLTFIL